MPVPEMRLSGLVAATYTPMTTTGALNLAAVPAIVDFLIADGVTGLYVCGSTGEGVSLSTRERQLVAEAYQSAVAKRVPVIVQVGHNSLAEAKQLAAHAKQIGADAISATCPSYFKVTSVDVLSDCMKELAGAAPELPFYYYHIPSLTGSSLNIAEFMQRAGRQIENLVGLKYTDTKLFEFQECLRLHDGRFDVVWGCDEMLLGALATGTQSAIGSTYNIAAPLYRRIIGAIEQGDLETARNFQAKSWEMIRTIGKYPFHPAMKQVLAMLGHDLGPCRLPQPALTAEQKELLHADLEAIGFFAWRK